MNIQRKYSLPNCTILLEGLSDASRASHFQDLRPVLSILVNAECYISGLTQPLVGGRDFFESLVRSVSAYAQEFLSNVQNPLLNSQESELVQLQKIDSNQHRLIVYPETINDGFTHSSAKEPVEIDLNTVQLFDLVEAIDQFFADSQTLPELSLGLQPLPRRYGAGNQALIKQAVPASVGVGSLAAAALVLALVPIPEMRPPEVKPNEGNSQTQTTPTPTPGVEPTPTASPIAEATPTPTTSPTAEATPTPTTSPIAEATPTPNPTPGATPAVGDIEALLATVPEITDSTQLKALNRQVYNQINSAWALNARSGHPDDLVYRVGVAPDGAIVGYKSVNSVANDLVDKTPLPNVLYNQAARGAITNEPIAQFKVVFTRNGQLQVSPWRGYTNTPDVVGTKITDQTAVQDLNQKLQDSIRQNTQVAPVYKQDLKYRVAVNQQGVIADYEPLNQAAFDNYRETALYQIFKSVYGSNTAPPNTKEPLAHFEVVLKPDGSLEVTPWQGYR